LHAHLHLRVGVDVRVVPVRAGFLDDVAVREVFSRLHGILDPGIAVHLLGDPQSVPVDRRWFVDAILEMDDDLVADLGLQQRPGDRAVVGEHGEGLRRGERNLELRSGQGDLDDVLVGVLILEHRNPPHLGELPPRLFGLAGRAVVARGLRGGHVAGGRRRLAGRAVVAHGHLRQAR
jgi:hypothetical protein